MEGRRGLEKKVRRYTTGPILFFGSENERSPIRDISAPGRGADQRRGRGEHATKKRRGRARKKSDRNSKISRYNPSSSRYANWE